MHNVAMGLQDVVAGVLTTVAESDSLAVEPLADAVAPTESSRSLCCRLRAAVPRKCAGTVDKSDVVMAPIVVSSNSVLA